MVVVVVVVGVVVDVMEGVVALDDDDDDNGVVIVVVVAMRVVVEVLMVHPSSSVKSRQCTTPSHLSDEGIHAPSPHVNSRHGSLVVVPQSPASSEKSGQDEKKAKKRGQNK